MQESRNKLKAFSLFELSIVITLIAVLLASVTVASRLIQKSKINAAQTLTKFSPVRDIDGLMLWFEPVMPESFVNSEAKDGYNLTQWNDINPNAEKKYYLLRTAEPVGDLTDAYYSESDGANSLPSIYFPINSVTNAAFGLSDTLSSPDFLQKIITQNNAFTFFIVEKTVTESTNDEVVFYNGDMASDNGWGYIRKSQTAGLSIGGDTFYDGITLAKSTPYIVSATFAGGSLATLNVFENGVAGMTQAVSGVTPSSGFFLGYNGGEAWQGYVSELIIFDHVLKINDRKAVEVYLGKKYGITVAGD
jgi:hypothetical protein